MKTLPNFIIVGAQKAGTTAFFSWLSQHPQIYGDEAFKDFNFFLNDYYYKKLGLEWFANQFKPSNEKIIVHGYVNYLYFYPQAVERLLNYKKSYVPDLKLVAVLRNPIDRAYSAFWDAKKVAVETAETFEEAIKKEPEILKSGTLKEKASLTYIDHGFYFEQVRAYKEAFGDDFKVFIFEELVKNPEPFLKEVFSWLGVDEGFTPNFEKKNESGLPRSMFLQKLIQRFSLPQGVKGLIPASIRGLKWKLLREWNIKRAKYPPMNPKTREYLKELYREDIKKLEKLINKDLSVWLK